MKSESIISWNFPNFITIVLMMAIIWVVIGTAGHVLVRQPAARRNARPGMDNTTVAPNGVAVA